MSKETIDRLFDISRRFSTKGTDKETGTGLVPLFCKEFIEIIMVKFQLKVSLVKELLFIYLKWFHIF